MLDIQDIIREIRFMFDDLVFPPNIFLADLLSIVDSFSLCIHLIYLFILNDKYPQGLCTTKHKALIAELHHSYPDGAHYLKHHFRTTLPSIHVRTQPINQHFSCPQRASYSSMSLY